MLLIDELQSASTDVHKLEKYLNKNFQEIYDFFIYGKHNVLLELKDKINRYIALNISLLRKLDIKSSINLSFITLLLDVSERLGFLMEFKLLYTHLHEQQFNIGRRLEAASLYLVGIHTLDEYINRYEVIYNHLQTAYKTEEDNADKVIATLLNYYAQVIYNFAEFNQKGINIFRRKIEQSKNASEETFLKHTVIDELLKIDTTSYIIAYEKIHSLLDIFLGRDIAREFIKRDFFIENATKYYKLLEQTESEFNLIRQVSVAQYNIIPNNSKYFHSLLRGVKILTEEEELYAYMYSFGKMHYNKLVTSFNLLPKEFHKKEIIVIDWACGQAMGSMSYLDYLKKSNITQNISSITLIEPSVIALKRASLHLKTFDNAINIITINKDIDALAANDVHNGNKAKTKLHLFSNILDIDLFSLTHLLELIKIGYPGDNYFICISPYVTDIKTGRIDSFVNYFSKMPNFKVLASIDNKKGEWINDWTRVLRIFKVTIS